MIDKIIGVIKSSEKKTHNPFSSGFAESISELSLAGNEMKRLYREGRMEEFNAQIFRLKNGLSYISPSKYKISLNKEECVELLNVLKELLK